MTKLLSIILISCLGIIVYSNTFHCSFHFDDRSSITDNFSIRNIADLQSIWHFWPSRFLTYLSIALNYHFNGLDVFGYHLFNLGVHLVSAVLVWWLTLLTFSTPAMRVIKGKGALQNAPAAHVNLIALFAGLIFVSHPVQTQAITYIVQRAASLATLFYLASICLYVKSRLAPGRPYYIFALITAIAAMFSKEIAITLPLMILLYEYSFLKTKQGINWKALIPFMLTLLIIPLSTLLTKSFDLQRMQRIGEQATNLSSMQYFLTQLRVIATYIRLLFLPVNQNLDYDYHISNSFFELHVLFSFLFLIIVLYFAKRLFTKYRLLSFSIFWFFLSLLPESSVIPIKDVIFEHRLYLPLVGYSLFLSSGIYYFPQKSAIIAIIIGLSMIVACNSVLTYQRNKVWKDEFTLWDDTVRKSPHKARAYNNRGSAYNSQDQSAQAMSDYNKAIELDPQFPEAYYNRAGIYSSQNNYARALSDYNKAIEFNPEYPNALNNRGLVYAKQNNFPKAMSDYNNALALNPRLAKAYVNRGSIFFAQGNASQAISDYTRAIEIDSQYAESYNNRGLVYIRQGNASEALSDFTKAIEIDPDYAEAYDNRGSIYGRQGDFIQSVSDCNEAIKLNPKYASAYNNLTISYFNLKEFDKAWGYARKAEALGYKVSPALINALKHLLRIEQ